MIFTKTNIGNHLIDLDQRLNKAQPLTMCIIHKGFRSFIAVSPASIFGGKLIGLKPEIPYDTIHSTLGKIQGETEND